jgi:hypothetical protein
MIEHCYGERKLQEKNIRVVGTNQTFEEAATKLFLKLWCQII